MKKKWLYSILWFTCRLRGKKGRMMKKAADVNGMWSRQYEILQQAYRDNAILFHDMDHHLQTIGQLASQGDCGKILDYIAGISTPVQELSRVWWTGVGIVDAILNGKREAARDKGYDMEIDAELPANTGIEAADFCTVLSNLLDNAIESMDRQKGNGIATTICVRLRRIHHFILIQVRNPYTDPAGPKRGIWQTVKADPVRHGWGLRSVRKTAQKYDGSFSCGVEDGCFVATALLFMR